MSTELPSPAPVGVRIEARTAAGFKCEVTHGPSGTALVSEAPKDNGGTGLSFSPTDLLATSLLTCTLTTMELAAKREGIPLGAMSGHVVKVMSPPPRRVAALPLVIKMPAGLSAEQRQRLEEVGRGCPVARSLSSDVQVSYTFEYPEG